MKIQILHDLQQEINRLFIAGSKFAHQDPRLIKLIPAFEKLGEKAPVFKKLSTQIQSLTAATDDDSAQQLRDLSTMVYTILYTQSETVNKNTVFDDNVWEPLIDYTIITTENTYLDLKPIIEALTTSKSGRLEVIEQAFKDNKLSDFRLYPHINNALGDKYTELAQFISNKVIPSIGKPMLPFLENSFELIDKSEQVRRFNAMVQLESEKVPALVDAIMGMSLPNLQAVAINYLKDYPTNENLILELAKDKNKIVRGSAYAALASMNQPHFWDFLYETFEKSPLKVNEELIEVLSIDTQNSYTQLIINTLEQIIIQILKPKDDKTLKKAINALEQNIIILLNKEAEDTVQFLHKLLKNEDLNNKLSHNNQSAYYSDYFINRILMVINSWSVATKISFHESLELKINPKENWSIKLLQNHFEIGFKHYAPENFYDLFHDSFRKGWVNLADLLNYYNNDDVEIHMPNHKPLDQRWEPLIVEKIEQSISYDEFTRHLIYVLALLPQPNNQLIDSLLLKQIREQQLFYTYNMLDWIIQRNIPDFYEVFFQKIANNKWSNSYWDQYQLTQLSIWNTYPIEYAAKFQELSDKKKTFPQGAEIANLIIAGKN